MSVTLLLISIRARAPSLFETELQLRVSDSAPQASKAAALNFYDTLRMELGGDIRITEVVPGVVESEITKGKIITKEGEMKVDQDERDVRIAQRLVVDDDDLPGWCR